MILKCARHNFTGGGRAFIDQDHQRNFFQFALCILGEALDGVVVCITAPKLGRCFVHKFAFCQLAVGGNHGDVFWQESGRQGHCGVQQTTGVVAQIKHQALELGVLLEHVFKFLGEIFHCSFLELRNPNPAIAWLNQSGFDRLGFDFLTNNGDCERTAFVFAENGEDHFGVGLTPHALDRIVHGQTFDDGLVNFGNEVVGFQACAVGWRAFNGGHHFDHAFFLRDLNAHTHKAPGGALAEFFEAFLVEVLRVRVEAGDHARDGFGNELFLVDCFDIVAFHHAKHGRQLLEFFKRQGRKGTSRCGLKRNGGERAR